jgi:hypothetical protein
VLNGLRILSNVALTRSAVLCPPGKTSSSRRPKKVTRKIRLAAVFDTVGGPVRAGTAAFTPELLNFLKNTAMMGGLLFIAATESQPTLLPRSARSNVREWTRNEGPIPSTARAS